MREFQFYLDLRCPFCFVQVQRVTPLASTVTLVPHTVRHDRPLAVPAEPPDDEVKARLAGYFERLHTTEGVALSIPALWPSTLAASTLIAAAVARAPETVFSLTVALFEALWVQHEDISSAAVLHRVRRATGLSKLNVLPEDSRTLAQWQKTWNEHSEEWKTPLLLSPHGGALIGLSDTRRIQTFLASGRLSSATDDVC